jgi:hypothetical protein
MAMRSQNLSGRAISSLLFLRQSQELVRRGPRTQSWVSSLGNRPRRLAQSSGLRSVLIKATAIGVILGPLPATLAQPAADHAAQAHGRPIVHGHPVQPTPDAVKERWKHHEQSLKAKQPGPTHPLTNGNSDTQ